MEDMMITVQKEYSFTRVVFTVILTFSVKLIIIMCSLFLSNFIIKVSLSFNKLLLKTLCRSFLHLLPQNPLPTISTA